MKLLLYKFLHNYTFFLYIKDFFLSLYYLNISKEIKDEVMIVTSIIPFDKMKQRPQQMTLSLSRIYPQKTVIYFEIDFGKLSLNYYRHSDNLIITNSLLILKKYLENKNIDIIATGNIKIPELLKLLGIRYESIIFDYYDNLDGYDDYLYKSFLNNLNKYNKITCSAKLLEDQLLNEGYKNTIYLPNGVNPKDWIIENGNKSQKIKENIFNTDKKIVGFYGGIEHWLDYELIKDIIINNKDKLFVFIGPDNGNYLKNNGILDLENFLYLGYMSFKELKYYSYFFDIAIIPFKINKITNAVSPVKFFEYLIQGKPVVTTGFREILYHKDHCFVSNDISDFNKNINRALEKSSDLNYVENIRKYSINFEWDSLVKNIFN